MMGLPMLKALSNFCLSLATVACVRLFVFMWMYRIQAARLKSSSR